MTHENTWQVVLAVGLKKEDRKKTCDGEEGSAVSADNEAAPPVPAVAID